MRFRSAGVMAVALSLLAGVAIAKGDAAYAASTTFYVDASSGDDSASGTSADTPWRTLARVTAATFSPGDTVAFKRGATWHGSVTFTSSGSNGNPITVTNFGSGPLPVLAGDGTVDNTLYLHNVHDVTVDGLEVTNSAGSLKVAKGRRAAVRIDASDMGAVGGISVVNNYIHDIDGDGTSGQGGYGGLIADIRGGGSPTWFSNLKIDHNEIANSNNWGVDVLSAWSRRDGISNNYPNDTPITAAEVRNWTPATGLTISNNYVHDVTGGGITAIVATSPLIEGNTVMRASSNRLTSAGGNVGIWWQGTDAAVVQKNVVGQTGLQGVNGDGFAFDSDIDTHRSLVQNNFSFDNCGGFFMDMYTSEASTVRYNISHGDTKDLVRFTRSQTAVSRENRIYNNTSYIVGGVSQFVGREPNFSTPVPVPAHEVFNNIFYSAAGANGTVATTTAPGTSFHRNLYYAVNSGRIVVPASDHASLTTDPLFTAPKTSSPTVTGLVSWSTVKAWFSDYNLGSASAARGSGSNAADAPTVDPLGTTLPPGAPDLGAVQHTTTATTASASSSLGTSSGAPGLLLDGRLDTGWASSDTAVLPGDLTFTFGEPRTFDAVTFASYFAQGQAPTNVTISTNDGSGWVVRTQSAPLTWRSNSALVEYQRVGLPQSVAASSVRITINSANRTYRHAALNELFFTNGMVSATSMGSYQTLDINDISDGSAAGWMSSGDAPDLPATLALELPANETFDSLTLSATYAQTQAPKTILVQRWDGTAWVTVQANIAMSWSTNSSVPESQTVTLPSSSTSRRVRVVVLDPDGSSGRIAVSEMSVQ